MIRHIVMFRLPETFLNEDKKDVIQKVKSELEQLPEKIDEIVSYEVGINFVESPRAFDLILISSFESEEKLNIYRDHPEHQKVVSIIKELKLESAVVDYKI
ncbi:MAG: stress responsive protein [Marinilabiliales bacterium]|nr:MAG: stress responsive protein [Marinilabiliales bacterium]